jgi:signal peptidase II
MGDSEASLGAVAPPVPAPATDEGRLKRTRRRAFAIALFVFAIDQLVKWIVTYPLNLEGQYGQTINILPIFDLHWTENRGVSLGLLSAGTEMGRWGLVALTAAIATLVTAWMWRERKGGDAFALALVLGGALGNILDRFRIGYVVDYADLHFGDWHPFLVFNIADAGIVIGVLLLLVRALLMRDGKASSKEV